MNALLRRAPRQQRGRKLEAEAGPLDAEALRRDRAGEVVGGAEVDRRRADEDDDALGGGAVAAIAAGSTRIHSPEVETRREPSVPRTANEPRPLTWRSTRPRPSERTTNTASSLRPRRSFPSGRKAWKRSRPASS